MEGKGFESGLIMQTAGVKGWAVDDVVRASWVMVCMHRHLSGDWGDLDPDDAAENDRAVAAGDRILSAYAVPTLFLGESPEGKMWIITEADRSATTALWPSEY
jgi:hypothetical protein